MRTHSLLLASCALALTAACGTNGGSGPRGDAGGDAVPLVDASPDGVAAPDVSPTDGGTRLVGGCSPAAL